MRLRSGASVAEGNESMAETSRGSCGAADSGQLGGQHQQVGRRRQRRHRPREHQREREAVGRLVVVGLRQHGVLEREQRPRVDLEREVEIERAAASLLGMEVDLPRLAQ